MRIHLGDYVPQPCASIKDAANVSCVVVPGITKGTIVMPDTPYTNVWAGQLVDIPQSAKDAYQANVAAAQAAGGAIMSTADPGVQTMAPAPVESAAKPADNSWILLAAALGLIVVVAG